MIRPLHEQDFDQIWTIINDGARAYQGVIPADRWHDPYMTRDELRREIDAGVRFWGCETDGVLTGVMGVQAVKDVTLIRHAYVRTVNQRQGIGALLLAHLQGTVDGQLLIGTWADAHWAIGFYQKNGFTLTSEEQKNALLCTYWNIPPRQVETSVVLALRPL
jgi:GNAT superfamily N-acetyltransferase